jgi:hypothetical protein
MPLPEALRDIKPGLHAWRNGDTPSAFVNASRESISAWSKFAPRSVFVHPAANGPVAVAWQSPIDGKVRITGRVKDAHKGGPDGIGWTIEHFSANLSNDLLPLGSATEKRAALERQRAGIAADAPRQEVAYAVAEGNVHDVKMHLRGDPEKPGPVVHRRWLELFGGTPVAATAGSGRLELAAWIASKENPLTARVMANRIWLHHFGAGLVKTPNDFGTRGSLPTHPELLDWLAAELVAPERVGGLEAGAPWSLKHLHKLILLSETYRQASVGRAEAAAVDPNNDLLWRFNRRRLSAEELRDTILAASGRLDRAPGAAHPFPPESSWGFSQHVPFSTFYDSEKRSVYLVVLRNRRHPFLGLFDGADPNATTPQRQTTTVPTQALYFLNDPFFHTQAARLAVRAAGMSDDGARLDELFRLALQRAPTARERETLLAFRTRYSAAIADQPLADRTASAWAAIARIVLASNEFLYLD